MLKELLEREISENKNKINFSLISTRETEKGEALTPRKTFTITP